MPCDTTRKRGQTIQQRATEIRQVQQTVERKLANGQSKIIIDRRTGAITFTGLTATERDDVTDACLYRRIMASGSAQAKLAIQKAEMAAGRTVNRQALAAGVHSHDGGQSWHHGH